MKTTSQCPKCDGRKIIRIPTLSFGDHRSNIIGVGFMKLSQAKVTRYLCCHCGFSEEWVDYAKDIAKIEKSYDNHDLDEFV